MPNFFALGDILARGVLCFLPRRISDRVRANASPLEVLVLRTNERKLPSEPRMTLFEAVFATLLFDLALFGTSNFIINGIISLFTSIQNSWDTPFAGSKEAEVKVRDFCERLAIQRAPWIWEKPAGEYTSLNDFFSRTYAPEHFPALGNGRVVSPACCKVNAYDDDTEMKSILIKGCNYDVGKIGLPTDDLEAYRSNRVFLGYLSPKDYHRVHAPIAGKCIHCKMEDAGQRSASVKFFGGKFNLLNENRRLVVVLEEEHANCGSDTPLRVALVIVGGVGVDTITYDKNMLGKTLGKGHELSAFRAGGSAFAMLSTKPLGVIEPIVLAGKNKLQVEVLIGENLVN